MHAIYDRHGQAVGWLHGDVILDERGRPVAFVRDGAAFAYDGRHLGHYVQGFFRDITGSAVAWIPGATGAPPLAPRPSVAPTPPAVPEPPAKRTAPAAPHQTIPSTTWGMSWRAFLGEPAEPAGTGDAAL
jgi:hypothetical protein